MQQTTHRWLSRLRAVVVLAFVFYAPYYLIWRTSTFNPDAPVFSWVIWGAEVYGYLTALLHFFMVRKLSDPQPLPLIEGARVAVLIPTYNESPQLVRHTLSAAVRMDYPHETWLLDDGNRKEMAALAAELGARYLARTDNVDAKAGNLNNALRHTDAEFIAVFDADHVPARDFLTRTLGFFRDSTVAFVQTPQEYYNLDSYQHRQGRDRKYLWMEQGLFFRVIQRGKDHHRAAYFCGSCAVLRRSALDAIGGFATGTVTEDLHTSLRLHKHGFASVYYPRPLAYGLAPDSPHAFLVQRRRWGQGAMQVWLRENVVFGRGLTLAQRLNYTASLMTYFDGWQKAIFYLAPAIVLVTGVMPVAEFGWTFLAHFLPFYILCLWSFEEAGRGYGGTLRTEQYNMARFATFIWATVSGIAKRLRFRVTPKHVATHARSRWEMLPQGTILIASLGAVILGAWLYQTRAHLAPGAFWANVFWAMVNLGLAGAVLRFARAKRHRRSEYRFPIPLPAQFRVADGSTVLGVIEDISVDGCRFVAEGPLPGDVPLDGEIYSPAGRIAVHARIARRDMPVETRHPDHRTDRAPRPKHTYGLRFEHAQPADYAELERCLFGSDLQWRVLETRDSLVTPVAWLTAKLAREPPSPARARGAWLPVVVRPSRDSDRDMHFGVLFRPVLSRETPRLILFDPACIGESIEMDIFGTGPRDRVKGRVLSQQRISDPYTDAHELRIEIERRTRDDGPRASGFVSAAIIGIALSLVAVLRVQPARAAERLVLAGAEAAADANRYAYLGALLPFGGSSQLDQGWVHRLWLDWLEYRFDSNGREISATGPGASWMLGYRGGARHKFGVFAGVTYRDTELDPDDPNVSNRGRQVGVGAVAELGGELAGAWNYGLIASLTEDPAGSYWTRLRLLRPLREGPIKIGFETVGYGDPDFFGAKIGGVVERFPLGRHASFGVKFGVNKVTKLDAGAYAGIDVGWVLGRR